MTRPSIRIPFLLALGHGGAKAAAIGAKWAETFETVAGLSGDDSVLDIGCGPGRMAVAIGERFGWSNAYLGFDTDARAIAFCERRIAAEHPNFRFAHLAVYNGYYNRRGGIAPDAAVFPAPPAGFSFAFATSVFTHMFRKDVEHYAAETFAALKPGGRFLSTWFLIAPDAARAKPRFNFRIARDDGTRVTTRYKPERAVAFAQEDARRVLTDAGFTIEAVHRGAWAGPKDARHSQDIVVARKR
jgi:SAM-dependent methyltransferase